MAALGVVLFVIGAILAFALRIAVTGVDLYLVGVILMGAGVVAFVAGLFRDAPFTRRRSERYVSDDGRHVVDETRTGL
ncbi:MAG: DUF6458 family protein [Acidimicrobiia bacterium]